MGVYKIMVKSKKGWRTVKNPLNRNKSLIAYGDEEAEYLAQKYNGRLKKVM